MDTEPSPQPPARIKTPRVWVWAPALTVCGVLAIWAGTELAIVNDVVVGWFAAFGSWLGAFGSIVASTIALWIVTTDRQRTDDQHKAEVEERNADLQREAGLVRIDAAELAQPSFKGGSSAPGVAILNRRHTRIFDIEIVRLVIEGKAVDPAWRSVVSWREKEVHHPSEQIPRIVLDPDRTLVLHPDADVLADFVAVQYTDQSGLRWQVDTARDVKKIAG